MGTGLGQQDIDSSLTVQVNQNITIQAYQMAVIVFYASTDSQISIQYSIDSLVDSCISCTA